MNCSETEIKTRMNRGDSQSIMRTAAQIVLVATLVFLSSCSSNNNPAMTGTWLFVFTPTGASTNVLQGTANLTQVGSQVTGQVTLNSNAAPCSMTALMSGTVKGNSLTLQITQSNSSVGLIGTTNLAFTSASGTYTADSGSCLLNGQTGSWSAALD
jgi:hypothetical protein